MTGPLPGARRDPEMRLRKQTDRQIRARGVDVNIDDDLPALVRDRVALNNSKATTPE